MDHSDKKTTNQPECLMALVATSAKESLVYEGRGYDFCSVAAPNHVLAVDEDLETRLQPMEIGRHGSQVETPSLYRRGRQTDRQFHGG